MEHERRIKTMSKVSGIRLHNMEIYNWGTFDDKIWTFNPNGAMSLLIGDSGSGKSTIVDALSTLLVAPSKVQYNKAADASAKERSVRSYVRGYYGRKQTVEGKGEPVALRTEKSYSVILATFKDMVEEKIISLAIFFWFTERGSNVSRIYAVSDKELSIAEDFSNFKDDIRYLKNRLRKSGAKINDSFIRYAEEYRKLMGGVTAQAIDLFQQTISMKKVDALNEFVRESMLEKEDVNTQIEELLKHYRDLDSAYEAVKKAKEQIQSLEPIHENGKEYTDKVEQKIKLDVARDSLGVWFAIKKRDIISAHVKDVEHQIKKLDHDILLQEKKQNDIDHEIQHIIASINKNGGDELRRLEEEIQRYNIEFAVRKSVLDKYNKNARKLGLKLCSSRENYDENSDKLPKLEQNFIENRKSIQDELTAVEITINEGNKKSAELTMELESLKERSSNIPAKLIHLRDQMCRDLEIKEYDIPFAGELLEVDPTQISWEGALERLVHGFAISLLVQNNHYSKVSEWVNKKHLGTKIVYFRVTDKIDFNSNRECDVHCAANKLIVKKDTYFTKWISAEINKRFRHICCDNIADFRKEDKAITKNGQFKSGRRHEKDDRHKISDRMRYVLGFSNKKKIEVLTEELKTVRQNVDKFMDKRRNILSQQDDINEMLSISRIMREYDNYEKIDSKSIQKLIFKSIQRMNEIKESSSILDTLKKQKERKQYELIDAKNKSDKLKIEKGKRSQKYDNLQMEWEENEEKIMQETENDKNIYSFLEDNFMQYMDQIQQMLAYNDKNEKGYLNYLTKKADSLQSRMSVLKANIEKMMARFKNAYPSETLEFTDKIDSIEDYNAMLYKLSYDNLPKYQNDFKNELQGKIIRHISLFSAVLYKYRSNIISRIEEINQSLKEIDYNVGRYIILNCEDSSSQDIAMFKSQLRACTEGIMNLDNELLENKFMQIKEIIERFKGRQDTVEADKRWTTKVTDVRNWFIFSATERYRDNDEEYEHYSDSDGKSGGQKEKLAYTILAASLAYNYKLNKKTKNGSTFRLVVIDEAFLKSSDKSAQFGLKLFEQMKFQLMVVTPLLKISTITPFVSHVGFVSHSDITHKSEIMNMSIEQYEKNRKLEEDKRLGKLDALN